MNTENFEALGTNEEECTLQQVNGPVSEWSSCILEFKSPRIRNSDTMFCLYASNVGTNEELFSIDRDSEGTADNARARSAECKYANQKYTCKKRLNWNYFIKINLPEYDGILKSGIKFTEGLKQHPNALEKKITDILDKCIPDEQRNCVIQFEVGSQSEGIISLSNSLILIDGSTIKFQKYREKPEIITNISGKDLTKGFNLTLPLAVIDNLTAPAVQYVQILPLKLSFGSRSIYLDVEITPSALQGEDLNATITRVLSKINGYMNSDLKPIIDFMNLNLNTKKTSLQGLSAELTAVESNSSMSEQNKTAQRDRIRSQLADIIKDIPQDLFILNKAVNIPSVPPNQIEDVYLPQDQKTDEIKEYVLSVQKMANIISNVIAYKIKISSGDVKEKTIIIRDVTTNLANPYLIEEIPSFMATSTDIEFKEPATRIGQTNSLKLPIRNGASTLIYQINGDITQQLQNIKTFVVSTEGVKTEDFIEPVCGDQKCTIPLEDRIVCPEDCRRKIPWIAISSILIIFFILVYYINFYKGKYRFASLFQKKNLFKTEADKINLINYVERTSQKDSKENITKTLLSRGWTKRQVEHVFDKIKKRKK